MLLVKLYHTRLLMCLLFWDLPFTCVGGLVKESLWPVIGWEELLVFGFLHLMQILLFPAAGASLLLLATAAGQVQVSKG